MASMALPLEDLTPRQIVAELDKYIVGQDAAKRAVAIALRNRIRRQRLPETDRDDVIPKNILMIGSTGVGKTEIARRLARIVRAPFIKVEATKFTEVGYVGRDVDAIIRDLLAESIRVVEAERMADVREEAERRALDTLVEELYEPPKRKPSSASAEKPSDPVRAQAWTVFGHLSGDGYPDTDTSFEDLRNETEKRKSALRKQIAAGKLDDRQVEIETKSNANPFVQIFSNQGIQEMGLDGPTLPGLMGKTARRKVTVGQAREILVEEEARNLIDRAALERDAIYRAEQSGIVFIDEIDKVAGKSGGAGPDVSRQGVQRDLLPIIEGSTVQTKHGPVRTDHILFICAGAFHVARPSDLIPELQGRLPIRVELQPLGQDDLRRILMEPKNSLTRQYESLLATDGVKVTFEPEALEEIARIAADVNTGTENIGARRLHTVLERLLEEPLFEAPEGCTEVRVTVEMVREKLGGLASDVDLSRYIL